MPSSDPLDPKPSAPKPVASATPWDENDFSAYRSTVRKETWLLRGLFLLIVGWFFGWQGVLLLLVAMFVKARRHDRLSADERQAVPPPPTNEDYRKSGWWGPWGEMPWRPWVRWWHW